MFACASVMPPAWASPLWEHAELELRLGRSGKYFYVSGHDSAKRIHEKFTENASREKILSKVDVSESNAAAIVVAINHALGVSNSHVARCVTQHFMFCCETGHAHCLPRSFYHVRRSCSCRVGRGCF